jgi:hypothetical protein
MKLIVTDANVLMFLSHLELMESFVNMAFEIHTTDYIIDEYYKGEKKDKRLKRL